MVQKSEICDQTLSDFSRDEYVITYKIYVKVQFSILCPEIARDLKDM